MLSRKKDKVILSEIEYTHTYIQTSMHFKSMHVFFVALYRLQVDLTTTKAQTSQKNASMTEDWLVSYSIFSTTRTAPEIFIS